MLKQKRFAVPGLIIVTLLCVCLFSGMALAADFSDVHTGDWYYDAVAYVSDNGLMTGVGSGSFAPGGDVTRGMIVTIIYRMEGSPSVAGRSSSFTDVAPNSWYAAGVIWAASKGIVSGYSDTEFGPEDRISREQLAAVCYRYAQYKGYDVSKKANISGFADAARIHDWAKDALSWANAAGLINGVGGNALDPQGRSTRAQAAAILTRFEQNVAGKPAPTPQPKPEPKPDTQADAYAAYLKLVQANRSTLDIRRNYYDTSTWSYGKEQRKTVAVLDVWGDELPELILGGCSDLNNVYNPLEPLQIYTYQNGKAVKLYERTSTCRYGQGEFLYYVLLQKAGGKELYLCEAIGHEASVTTWYRLSSSGTVTEQALYKDEYFPQQAGPQAGHHYYDGQGNPISESAYIAFEDGCRNANNTFVFIEASPAKYPAATIAMTYADAVVFLGGKAPAPAGTLIDSYLVQSGIEVYNSPWQEVLPKEPNGACNYIAVYKNGGNYYVSMSFYRLFGADGVRLDYDQVSGTATFKDQGISGKIGFSDGKITLTLYEAPYLDNTVHVFSK